MTWGAVAAAGIAVGGSILSGKQQAKAQIDAVETPTRQTGLEQSLREAFETQDTESVTSVLEEIFGTEVTNQLSQATQQTTTDETTTQTGTTEQTSEQVVQRGGEQSQAALAELITQLQGGSEDRMQTAIDQVLRSGLPAVSGARATSGAFNDTTTALLQNDLVARAAAAGLGAEDAQRQQLLDAITASQAGTETITGTSTTEEQLQSILEALQASTSTEETSIESETSQTREATEETETSTETAATEGTTNVSDTFANPSDATRPTGDLATLVNQGDITSVLDSLAAQLDVQPEAPASNTPVGTQPSDIPAPVAEIPGFGGGPGSKPNPGTPILKPRNNSTGDLQVLAALINNPDVAMDGAGNISALVRPNTKEA